MREYIRGNNGGGIWEKRGNFITETVLIFYRGGLTRRVKQGYCASGRMAAGALLGGRFLVVSRFGAMANGLNPRQGS